MDSSEHSEKKRLVVYSDGNPDHGKPVTVEELVWIIRNRFLKTDGEQVNIVLAPCLLDIVSTHHLKNFIKTQFPEQVVVEVDLLRSAMDFILQANCRPNEVPYNFINGAKANKGIANFGNHAMA